MEMGGGPPKKEWLDAKGIHPNKGTGAGGPADRPAGPFGAGGGEAPRGRAPARARAAEAQRGINALSLTGGEKRTPVFR